MTIEQRLTEEAERLEAYANRMRRLERRLWVVVTLATIVFMTSLVMLAP